MRAIRCPLYLPGHSVHFLQARQIAEFSRHFPERSRKVILTDLGAGWFEVDLEGEVRRGWDHDQDLVTDIARDSVLEEVRYIPDFHALIRRVGDVEGAGTVLIPAWGAPRSCVTVEGSLPLTKGHC